jgi:hypothetical protein
MDWLTLSAARDAARGDVSCALNKQMTVRSKVSPVACILWCESSRRRKEIDDGDQLDRSEAFWPASLFHSSRFARQSNGAMMRPFRAGLCFKQFSGQFELRLLEQKRPKMRVRAQWMCSFLFRQ